MINLLAIYHFISEQNILKVLWHHEGIALHFVLAWGEFDFRND